MKTPKINNQLFANWDTSDLLEHFNFLNDSLRNVTLPREKRRAEAQVYRVKAIIKERLHSRYGSAEIANKIWSSR